MITALRVNNFRTLVNFSAVFHARHLLIGKNNSGKSNVGLAISFPKLAAKANLNDAMMAIPGGAWDFCNYAIESKSRVVDFSLTLTSDSIQGPLNFEYSLSIQVGDPRQSTGASPASRVLSEKLNVSGGDLGDTVLLANDGSRVKLLHEQRFLKKSGEAWIETRAPSDSTMLSKLYELETNPTATLFRNALYGVSYFNFSAERIRNGWRDVRDSLGLWTAGDNLAQMIFQMKNATESRYRRVIDRVRRIEPKLVAINFLTGPDQNVVPIVELEGSRTASWASLSDGTMRAIAMAYVVEQISQLAQAAKSPTPIVIIEEPENSFYVGELRAILDDAENTASAGQVIFTTHSPYFIDFFDSTLDSVTLLRRRDWITEAVSLESKKSEIEEQLRDMPLGEQYFRELLA